MRRLQSIGSLSSRLIRVASVLALLAGTLRPEAAQAGLSSLSQLFVFGDSLSDIGNAGNLSAGYFPHLHTSQIASAMVR